jgi:uncharacterized membrane protein YtjA (UPF0391 family)
VGDGKARTFQGKSRSDIVIFLSDAGTIRIRHRSLEANNTRVKELEMQMGNLLYYAIAFLVVALVAAFLGFGGVAGTAMEGARILFWVAIVLFVISVVVGFIRRA